MTLNASRSGAASTVRKMSMATSTFAVAMGIGFFMQQREADAALAADGAQLSMAQSHGAVHARPHPLEPVTAFTVSPPQLQVAFDTDSKSTPPSALKAP